MMVAIDVQTAQRFILGKQGLWPARRWSGPDGTEQAMREMEHLQLDPLRIIARSHDIALQSRVADYTPGMWENVTYGQRKFFDWGGWLAVRSMDELPHWRVAMRRERDHNHRLRKWAKEHADTIVEMRKLLRRRDTVTNRDFRVADRTRTDNYRGRKDTSVALYYLWRIGEIMTYDRDNFERVYAPTEAIAPAHLIYESDDTDADRFFVLKEIGFNGLLRIRRTNWFRNYQAHIDEFLAKGQLAEVRVNGWPGMYLTLGQDVPLIESLQAGRVPVEWVPPAQPAEPVGDSPADPFPGDSARRGGDTAPLSTDAANAIARQEAVFLAPLEPVSARGRAKQLFDFDYIWEVYKPAAERRHGYYTLPVLWGDRLVARFDSKLDRQTNTYVILGFWLEEDDHAKSEAFAAALARGFARFVTFLGADGIDASAIGEPMLRERITT